MRIYKAGKTSPTYGTYNSGTTFPWIVFGSDKECSDDINTLWAFRNRTPPPSVLLIDYEQLRKNYEELRQRNEELMRSNEENAKNMQGITTLLQEMMPNIYIPQMDLVGTETGQHRSRDHVSRTPQHEIRIETSRSDNQVPEQ